MIAGAVAGGALAAWVLTAIAARGRVHAVRRRLLGWAEAAGGASGGARWASRGPTPAGASRRGRSRGGSTRTRHRIERRAVERRAGRRRQRAGPPGEGGAVLAECCDTIARVLRGGRSLSAAVVEAADRHDHPTLVEIGRAVGVGEQLPRAIDRVAAGSGDPDVMLVVQVLAVAAEHGGSPAEAIDRAAATLRERSALRAERRAQAASARLSTRVMTILPFAFTGFVAATDADVRDVLLHTPTGWTCLTIGIALNAAGRAWANRAVAA